MEGRTRLVDLQGHYINRKVGPKRSSLEREDRKDRQDAQDAQDRSARKGTKTIWRVEELMGR